MGKIQIFFAIAMTVALTTSNNSFAAQQNDINIGTKHQLGSTVLNETRQYWVSLPKSYATQPNKHYPVLYFFDGSMNSFFHVFSGMVNQLSLDASPLIPEMIVVGIVSKKRARESSPTHSLVQYGGSINEGLKDSGGAAKFLSFVADELVTSIDKNYRTTDYRIISGYSFTGLPVLLSLYTQPQVFNGYIAIDPSMWWDNQTMLKQYDKFVTQPALNKRRLFVATSQRTTGIYPEQNYVMALIDKLNNKPKTGLSAASVIFGPDENHHTMQILSFYRGLRYIFEGYMVDDMARFRPASDLKAHMAAVSAKLGSTFYLREDLVDWFGYDRLYNEQFGRDINRAIGFFKLNTENFPTSANTWDSLGEAYMVNKQNGLALQAYQKSLSLDSSNRNAKEKIAQLQ